MISSDVQHGDLSANLLPRSEAARSALKPIGARKLWVRKRLSSAPSAPISFLSLALDDLALNSIECVRCLAMGFLLLESPVQLADSPVRNLSTRRGALQSWVKFESRLTATIIFRKTVARARHPTSAVYPSGRQIYLLEGLLWTANTTVARDIH